MNISEFERKKPKKTFRILMGTIAKYQRLVDSLSSMKENQMNDKDVVLLKVYSDMLKDLTEIQKIFLSGE